MPANNIHKNRKFSCNKTLDIRKKVIILLYK